MLSVPDSEPIRAKLRAMASQALPFKAYASPRRKALGPRAVET
jgi:hypothetical protein